MYAEKISTWALHHFALPVMIKWWKVKGLYLRYFIRPTNFWQWGPSRDRMRTQEWVLIPALQFLLQSVRILNHPQLPHAYLCVTTLKSVNIYFSCKGSDFLSRPILLSLELWLCTYCLWRVEQFCLVVRDMVGRSIGARSKTVLAATSF